MDRDRDRDSSSQGSRETEGNFTERLRNALLGQSEGDLLMNGRNGVEIGFIRWLRALDLQVIGACRADERLKPLLKFDIFTGFAEGRLLNQFAQHFEASEVGMLARCLCVPLVSIRVGKVNKQGNLLCPSTVRGNLHLTLLPSSNLRISFVGDDGATERVAVISNSSEVLIEKISADISGRSFHITVPGHQVFYFWCSEKSKVHAAEQLAKMKDIAKRKPTLSDVTGIRESRLQSFASHLRSYLLNTSSNSSESSRSNVMPATHDSASTNIEHSHHPLHKASSSSPSKRRQAQHGISPKPITFKGKCSNKDKQPQPTQQSTNIIQLESPPIPSSLPAASTPLLEFPPLPKTAPSKSMFSPYYCWCPLQPPTSLDLNNSIPLPPLSSLLLSSSSSPHPSPLPQVVVPSKLPFDVPKVPVVTLPASTHISTFSPFMSDPIVHTPVIDICSSGQLYIVSAGPNMTSSVSPLLPSFVGHRPLMPSTESAVEKSARETLRMLMASAPPFNCLKKPSFLNNVEENLPMYPVKGSDDEGNNVNQYVEVNAVNSASSRNVDTEKSEEGDDDAVNNLVGCKSVDEFDSTNRSKSN